MTLKQVPSKFVLFYNTDFSYFVAIVFVDQMTNDK